MESPIHAKVSGVSPAPDNLVFRRNRLPQWRLDGGVYFVTWRLHNVPDSLAPAERSCVAECIRFHHGTKYRLSIYVVMDDHVHLLLQTLPGQDLSLSLQVLKGYSAYQINKLRSRKGVLWQKDSYTELLRNWQAVETRRQYIYDNPQRKMNVESSSYTWLEWFE